MTGYHPTPPLPASHVTDDRLPPYSPPPCIPCPPDSMHLGSIGIFRLEEGALTHLVDLMDVQKRTIFSYAHAHASTYAPDPATPRPHLSPYVAPLVNIASRRATRTSSPPPCLLP